MLQFESPNPFRLLATLDSDDYESDDYDSDDYESDKQLEGPEPEFRFLVPKYSSEDFERFIRDTKLCQICRTMFGPHKAWKRGQLDPCINHKGAANFEHHRSFSSLLRAVDMKCFVCMVTYERWCQEYKISGDSYAASRNDDCKVKQKSALAMAVEFEAVKRSNLPYDNRISIWTSTDFISSNQIKVRRDKVLLVLLVCDCRSSSYNLPRI